MSLQVSTGRERKEKRRQSQDFINLCGQFDREEGGGKMMDVSGMPGRDTSRDLKCSFAFIAGAGTSPGPRKGRGAQRKLDFKQAKLSLEVILGSTGVGSTSANQKRERILDSVAEGSARKKMKVSKS